jgi:hypothetical protein
MVIVRCNVELNSWNNLFKLEVKTINSSALVASLTVSRGLEHIKLLL